MNKMPKHGNAQLNPIQPTLGWMLHGLKEAKGIKELTAILNDEKQHVVLRKGAQSSWESWEKARPLCNGLQARHAGVRMASVQALSKTVT